MERSISARKLSFTQRYGLYARFQGCIVVFQWFIECISLYILKVFHVMRCETLRRVSV